MKSDFFNFLIGAVEAKSYSKILALSAKAPGVVLVVVAFKSGSNIELSYAERSSSIFLLDIGFIRAPSTYFLTAVDAIGLTL